MACFVDQGRATMSRWLLITQYYARRPFSPRSLLDSVDLCVLKLPTASPASCVGRGESCPVGGSLTPEQIACLRKGKPAPVTNTIICSPITFLLEATKCQTKTPKEAVG